MKSTISLIFRMLILVATMAASAAAINAQSPVPRLMGGVGPAEAGSIDASTLPESSRMMIDRLYPQTPIVKCMKSFINNTYSASLANGVTLRFNAQGEWCGIDAGDCGCLTSEVVASLLPKKAFKKLKAKKLAENVADITRTGNGYDVTTRRVIIGDFHFSSKSTTHL